MDNDTYIRLYRSFLNWQFYSDRNVKDVYLHCLLSANFKPKNWKGEIIGRGSFVTTYKKLSEELGMSPQEIRTAINKLIDSNDLTKKTTNKYTIITVVGYDVRQNSSEETTSKPTKRATNKQVKVEVVKKIYEQEPKEPIHYITERLFENNLINQNEVVLIDSVILECLELYNAVDVAIKSEYVLKQMSTKQVANRISYFKTSLITNLNKDYQQSQIKNEPVSNDDVDMDELDEFLTQFK